MAAVAEIIQNNVVVRGGKVVKVENWVCWNGTDWPVITIERKQDKFRSDIGDPEHGGGFQEGTLDRVIGGLHPDIQAEFRALFALENPTEDALAQVGFKGYLIIVE